jgi:hypothetical protein
MRSGFASAMVGRCAPFVDGGLGKFEGIRTLLWGGCNERSAFLQWHGYTRTHTQIESARRTGTGLLWLGRLVEVCIFPGGAAVRQLLTTVAACLVALAESLTAKPEDRALAARVLSKAEERALAEDDIVGLHFVYQEAIHLHYKWRDEFRDAMDLAFAACYKQMQCAAQAAEALRERFPGKPLPSHFGYQRTASLLEEQGAYGRASEICRQAKEQGWDGNWTWRLHCIAKRVRERGYSVTPISRSGVSEI